MVNLASTTLLLLAAASALAINWDDKYLDKGVECRTFVADPSKCVWTGGQQKALDTPPIRDCKEETCHSEQKYKGEVTLDLLSSRKPSQGFRYFIGNTSIGYHGPVVAVIEPGQTQEVFKGGDASWTATAFGLACEGTWKECKDAEDGHGFCQHASHNSTTYVWAVTGSLGDDFLPPK